MYALLRHQTDK